MKQSADIFSLNPHKEHILVVPAFEDAWQFKYPRLTREVHDEFYAALELLERGDAKRSEAALRSLVDRFPEFIDAHHHLAIILYETRRARKAREIWVTAASLGLSAFPSKFKTGAFSLPWGILDNRPFLRAYHSYGLRLLEEGDFEVALALFEHMLRLNPDDNQGARVLAVDCCFELGRPEEVMEILEQFPEDGLAESLYGRVLALFQLGELARARVALLVAARSLPLVAKELQKKTHRPPKDEDPRFVAHGGKTQAFYYWESSGEHWKNTEGAQLFVAEVLGKGH